MSKGRLHSIVVPVYNAREILPALVRRIDSVMEQCEGAFELILIDDGSVDLSFEEIKRLALSHEFIRGFRLSRNFGHQAALTIGLRQSRGEFVAIIDDDLQDPPEMLPHFFKELQKEWDVVYGVRKKRKEGWLKRIAFAGFYRVLNILSKIEIPRDSGDFCAMRRCVVDAMLQMYDANPFLRGFRSWIGFRQLGLPYERDARLQGDSGYTLRKYLKLALVGILMFSNVPLRLSMYVGLISALFASLYTCVILVSWIVEPFDVPGYLSLIVMVTFMGGVQLFAMGVMGEYIARLIENTRRWPLAFVAEQTERGEN